MTKITVAVLAFVLAGSAQAAGWRSISIDASSEARFNESVTALKESLPHVRKAVLEWSLQDIWVEGARAAAAADREYTVGDYLQQVDGLTYKEIVKVTDPSGDKADLYFDQAYASLYGRRAAPSGPANFPAPNAGVATFSGSKSLDAGQSFRAEGRLGGNHF